MSKAGFRLADHPWWSLLIFVLTWTLVMAVFFNMLTFGFNQPPDAPMTILIQNTLAHITTLFLLVPLVLRLPTGTRSFKTYLDAIRLSRVRPFFRLLLLGLSCYLILALCQAAGVLVYRALHGQPITLNFLRFAFDLASDLPPRSSSWLQSLPSVFEEVAFRGVILTLFLRHYPKPQSILIASLAFGAMHLLNLAAGNEPLWVLGQVVWATILGLFYSVLVLRSGSLWPAMLVHYLGNLFVGSINWYLNTFAPTQTQVVYGVLFTFGIIPTTLMILWVLLTTRRWPLSRREGPPSSVSHASD